MTKTRRTVDRTDVYVTNHFVSQDGDRYKIVRHYRDEIPSSGLKEVIIALLGFSGAGLVIYLSWAGAIALINRSSPQNTTTQYIIRNMP
ncbi:hypothetical protein HW132_02130 [Brasilonema sp. CT11]|nr:hypothetical protein [Brasilonema sp. CT11]